MKRILWLLLFSVWVLSCEQAPTDAPEPRANDEPVSEITADGMGGGAGIQQPNIQWEVPPDVELTIEKGYYGRLRWWGNNQSVYINLSYNQTRDELWIYYYLWENGSYTYRGWGYIPSTYLSGSDKTGFLHLDVDLSQVPNFYIESGAPINIVAHIQRTDFWTNIYGYYSVFRDNYTGATSGYLGHRKSNSAEGWITLANSHFEDNSWGQIGSLKDFRAWFTMPD